MKQLLILSLFLVLYSCFLPCVYASGKDTEVLSEVIADYKDKAIVRSSFFNESEEDELEKDTVSTISIEENLQKRLENLNVAEHNPSQMFILRYSQSALNDITFLELTDKLLRLLPSEQEKMFILDLSYNGLTVESTSSLQKWLDHKSIAYVSIDGNPSIAKRNIQHLCLGLTTFIEGDATTKKEKIREYFSKITFLPKYYINTAKRRVQIYRQLEEKGYLPEDWARTHLTYYKIVENASALDLQDDDCFSDPIDESAQADELE